MLIGFWYIIFCDNSGWYVIGAQAFDILMVMMVGGSNRLGLVLMVDSSGLWIFVVVGGDHEFL